MRAAASAARQLGVHRAADLRRFRVEVDEIVCVITPEPFYAVGLWYQEFCATTDQEVRELLAAVGHRYSYFEDFGENIQRYVWAARFDLEASCERQVIEQLLDLQRASVDYARRDGRVAEDELFYAEQTARLVKTAEAYYRTMFGRWMSSWNLRDRHMADTLEALAAYLRQQRRPMLVVWAQLAASSNGVEAERRRFLPHHCLSEPTL